MKLYSIILMTILSSSLFGQSNWYVDYQNGNNSNSGTLPSEAVKTVNYLTSSNSIQPKDTVFIIGQYNNPSYNPNFSYGGNNDRNNPHIWHQENSIKLNNLNGLENEYITFKPYDNSTVLKGDGANIFRITNCSYIRIEGFEIYGEVENIPLSTAEGLQTAGLQFLYLDPNTVDTKNPTLSEVLFRVNVGTSISTIESTTYPILGSVTRPSYTDTRGLYVSGSNHIEIVNNEIHHTCGGGLRISESSNVLIEDNEIHNCSRRSYSGTHALVVTKAKEGVTNSNDDNTYSIKILRNLIRDNYNEAFSWAPTKDIITPRIDEGKGISLQRNNLSAWQNGNKRILVENNMCYWNGFSGVHSNDGWHIDFVNNTCYMNSFTNTVTYAGQTQQGNNIGISAQNGDDIKIINNISVVDTDWNGFAISSGGTTNLVVDANIIFGSNGVLTEDTDITSIQTNTLITDPNFVNPTTFDFHLQPNSQAVDYTNTNVSYAPVVDYYGNSRDINPDLGAIEYIAPLSISHINLNDITIYPNPFNEKIIIDKPLINGEVSIYNVLGQNMTNYVSIISNGHNTEIQTTKLPNGMYIIKTKTFTIKVCKSMGGK